MFDLTEINSAQVMLQTSLENMFIGVVFVGISGKEKSLDLSNRQKRMELFVPNVD